MSQQLYFIFVGVNICFFTSQAKRRARLGHLLMGGACIKKNIVKSEMHVHICHNSLHVI